MNQLPGLSVILPVHNGMEFLPQAIESLRAQDHPDFEVVAVDDASRDHSWNFLSGLQDPRFRVYRNERNLGLFATLNRLTDLAKHDDLKIFCQDDLVHPGGLLRQHRFLADRPALGAARCLSSGDPSFFASPTVRAMEAFLPEIIPPQASALTFLTFGNFPGNLSQVICRRGALREAGGFRTDLPFAGDMEMWTRLSARHPIGLQNECLVEVRHHPGQGSKNLNRRNELVAQTDEVLSLLFRRLDPQDRLVVRTHVSLVLGSMQLLQGFRALGRGDWLAARRTLARSPAHLAFPFRLFLFLVSLNSRIGTAWTTRHLLRRILAVCKAEGGILHPQRHEPRATRETAPTAHPAPTRHAL